MAGFSDIIGHEQIIGHLKNAIALDKVSHAYIFNGPKLSGKMMLAEAFAMALQCEGEGTRPCLLCRSCKQAVDHNQPDIIYVSHEKPNTIGVDDIRTQINNDIVIKPYSSRYKVYIVDEAEKMNQQAQNALLKTIEEPPAYAVILLLTTNADSFLPTILSRCITLNLKVVKEDVIKSYLMKTYHIPDYQADVCAAFWPLSIQIFVRRHHPECRQIAFSGRNFCTALKISILKIMFSLCINTTGRVASGSVCIHRFHRLDQQFSVFDLNIFVRIHIFLPLTVDPAFFMQFHIPVCTV